MNEDNATRAELLEALAAQAARLARIETDRDVWRNESIKKQAACEQMGARIGALEAERDRMKKALQEIENPPPEVFDDGAWEICRWMRGRAEDALKGDNQ
jgi:hypothetical protein